MRSSTLYLVVGVCTGALGILSLLIGGQEHSMGDSLHWMLGNRQMTDQEHLAMVITSLRYPRLLLAIFVGGSLGFAGALLQTITRNPLAECGLLGVNSSSALAVVIGITYFGAYTGYHWLFWSLPGAFIGCSLVLFLSRLKGRRLSPIQLILAGIALEATFRGLTSFILLSHQLSYDQYRFWVLGSLAGVPMDMVSNALPVIIAGCLLAFVIVRPVSALLLGDETASNLGYSPGLIRFVVIISVTLLAGSSIALVGPIAFLGLMAPHAARGVAGPRMHQVLILSFLFGSLFLLAADILARVVVAPYETPASVLVAVIGSPLLIYLAWNKNVLPTGGGDHD